MLREKMGETTCVSFSQIVLVYPLYIFQIAKILSVTHITRTGP
jgi:hypothetical protein